MARILVVEDEQDARVLLNDLLERELGHEVVYAADGAAGIELYRETQPDLVITDLVMPEVHGVVLIEHLTELYPGVRIIAVSGRAPEQLERAAESGAIATLVKPIDRDALVAAVEMALGDPDPWERMLTGARGLPGDQPRRGGAILRSPMVQADSSLDDQDLAAVAHEAARERSTRSRAPDGRLFVDLSHTIEDGMVTYEGLPAPLICDYLSHVDSRGHYAQETEFQVGKIEMVANTGTYLDAPFHRFPGGKDVSELPLAATVGLPGVLVSVVGNDRAIDAGAFRNTDVGGKAVLVETGWSRHWRTDRYFEGHPFLTRDAAEHLHDNGARLVGIDSLNIDDTEDGERPVHTILLGAGIPIVEHLRGLEALRGHAFRFSAAPVKVRGFGSFPVRAYAEVVS